MNPLREVVAAHTRLSLVDGAQGRLLYRGYLAVDLAARHRFSEVAHLVWTGRLPDQGQSGRLIEGLRSGWDLPPYAQSIMAGLPATLSPMEALAVGAASLVPDSRWPPTLEDAVRLAGAVPALAAAWHQRLNDIPLLPPPEPWDPVTQYLTAITGRVPSPAHVRALEAYMVLTMEHGLNASTFAGRVALSTQSDITAGLTAALVTMRGPLHGGAPSHVNHMLDAIGDVSHAESWLRNELRAGRRLMGFGHRIYRTRDPRAAALSRIVAPLADQEPWWALAAAVEPLAEKLLAEYKPGRSLYANVEYWAAAVLKAVGVPESLYTATFSASRVVGWTAHLLEQAPVNRLIRPESQYIGDGAAPSRPD